MRLEEVRLAHLKRLWQPGRLLFWQMLLFNAMSSACAWALRSLPLNMVGALVIGLVGLLNVVFGLVAAWALLREPLPGIVGPREGQAPGGPGPSRPERSD